MLFDGEGLYLKVGNGGTYKSWVLRVTFEGKRLDVGLGSARLLSLADAREEARRLRREARLGNDPRKSRRKEVPTFAQAVETFLGMKLKEFDNPVHVKQWRSTLATYAVAPEGVKGLGSMRVDEIEPRDVLRILQPIWETKTETASRLRGRVEAVLSWAKAQKHRTGENPARWKDNLEHMLAKPAKLKTVKHHDALPWKDLPTFMADLSTREGISARCLELLILTATRSGEAREARWGEFDLDAGVWTIPAERMKMKREHRVPLSPQAVEVAHRVRGLDGDLVFPSPVKDRKGRPKPMDYNAFAALFERMGVEGVTAHGFRSTFRDWASDVARAPREVAEACLAHTVGSAVEQAYHRTDLFDRRRELMEAWADHACAKRS